MIRLETWIEVFVALEGASVSMVIWLLLSEDNCITAPALGV